MEPVQAVYADDSKAAALPLLKLCSKPICVHSFVRTVLRITPQFSFFFPGRCFSLSTCVPPAEASQLNCSAQNNVSHSLLISSLHVFLSVKEIEGSSLGKPESFTPLGGPRKSTGTRETLVHLGSPELTAELSPWFFVYVQPSGISRPVKNFCHVQ